RLEGVHERADDARVRDRASFGATGIAPPRSSFVNHIALPIRASILGEVYGMRHNAARFCRHPLDIPNKRSIMVVTVGQGRASEWPAKHARSGCSRVYFRRMPPWPRAFCADELRASATAGRGAAAVSSTTPA